MTDFDGLIQRLLSCQSTDEPSRKGISSTVRIDNLFVLESIDFTRLVVVRVAGGDGNGRISTVGEYDNTVASGVGFWLLGECLGNGGKVLRVRKAVCAGPSLGFGFVTYEVIDVRKDFQELAGEKLSDERSREVKDEDLGKSST